MASSNSKEIEIITQVNEIIRSVLEIEKQVIINDET
jgi:hypothetical protein